MSSPEVYNANYFERGCELGLSLYRNYRWMPEVSIPMACELKAMYPKKSILDFGCAKGFLVKAMRSLGIEAYGVDISKYAIACADDCTRPFLFEKVKDAPESDVVFSKDTLEHIERKDLPPVLMALRRRFKQAFMIVPFGENGVYRIKDYDKDLTHRITEPEYWWGLQFKHAGFKIETMTYKVSGFKDNWAQYEKGNGFYFLKS
jgi:SAM-dependent methyltransferase